MSLNPADAAFAERLAALLPPGTICPAEARHLEEPRGRVAGQGAFVALPRATGEAAAIVRACGQARVGIVPRGGGTGLVLGQVMQGGPLPLILSLDRMADIRGVWPEEGVLVADAGAVLADVQQAAAQAGRQFPLTLASQGSARIGGLLATNAGGVNVLRYGNARDLCLGIEAVLPDGSVINGLKRLRKDNTGYDLRNLLVGAEGTLGLITAASLKLHPIPSSVGTAILQVPSPAAALRLLALAQGRMAGCVTAFELIGGQGLAFLDEVRPDVRQPFADAPPMVGADRGGPARKVWWRMGCWRESVRGGPGRCGWLATGLLHKALRRRLSSGPCVRRCPMPTARLVRLPRMTYPCPCPKSPVFLGAPQT